MREHTQPEGERDTVPILPVHRESPPPMDERH